VVQVVHAEPVLENLSVAVYHDVPDAEHKEPVAGMDLLVFPDAPVEHVVLSFAGLFKAVVATPERVARNSGVPFENYCSQA
jgi:hypothetical protein